MTSNNSGISASTASTETTAEQQPDAATRAATMFDLGEQHGLDLAARRAHLTAIAHAATLGEDGDLIACEPLRPAATLGVGLTVPCPIHAWCLGHETGEEITAASLHHGTVHQTPAAGLYLHLDAGVASVALVPDSGDYSLLDPDEAESLACALLLHAAAARSVNK